MHISDDLLKKASILTMHISVKRVVTLKTQQSRYSNCLNIICASSDNKSDNIY